MYDSTAAAACVFVNNIVTPANGVYNTGVHEDSDYNACGPNTQDQTFGGAHDRLDQTFTFVGGGDYHLDADDTGAKGYGVGPDVDELVPITDIIGTSRTGNTCDIGAYETISTPAGSILTLIANLFRRLR